jgi:UDP-N-acetylglucosamine--N-acetylmuramyl-(pentapeptide) pyrophosphoryl-undecaprenol N-acetylglucosamine transferase
MLHSPKIHRFILSGGGTGGHIYPAIAIAEELRRVYPDCELLFVGAEGKMEMRLVPENGYNIEGLPVVGFDRFHFFKNFQLPFKLLKSLSKAKSIIKSFKPDAVIGTGGFASGPILWQAQKLGIPTFIQEQNAFAGVTNKILSKKATKIYTAFDNMNRWFPSNKIQRTGNPVRQLNHLTITQNEAKIELGFEANQPLVFVTGGSLGAVMINRAIGPATPKFVDQKIQLLWQCGKSNFKHLKGSFGEAGFNWKLQDFVSRMDLAFLAADLVVSRAGASTISELGLVGKPAILVPSPNVAEDHQTHNAQAIVQAGAAILVKDEDAKEDLARIIFKVMNKPEQLQEMAAKMKATARPLASQEIVQSIAQFIR